MSNKRRILKKLALYGLGVSALSALVLFVSLRAQDSIRNQRHAEMNEKRDVLVHKYRTYLNETAKKVTRLPVDPNIVGQVQARYFEEYSQARLYLWAADTRGEYLFGVPAEAFGRLNRAYDTYRQVIEKEGRFTDRQDFLRRLIQDHQELDFEVYEAKLSGRELEQRRWEQKRLWNGDDRADLTFSTPFLNDQGQMLGNMYLKIVGIDDRFPDWVRDYEGPLNVSALFLVVSLLFLWFLLPTWVYLDARGRGMASPARWSALALVSLIFGLTVYLILRPDEGGALVCQSCGRSTKGGRYCPYCGAVNSNEFCQKCGFPVRTEWAFCPNCQAPNPVETPEPADVEVTTGREATAQEEDGSAGSAGTG